MKYFKIHLLLPLVILSSCVNFKAVNDFAKASKETVQAYNTSNISLTESYKKIALTECRFGSGAVIKLPDDLTSCYDAKDLAFYKKSDSLISIVNTIIEKYFAALEDFSENQTTSFELKSENLEELLNDSTKFPSIDKDDHIEPAKNVVTKLTNAALTLYKRNQLKKIMMEVNDDLIKVLAMNKVIQEDIKQAIEVELTFGEILYENRFASANNSFDKLLASDYYIKEYNTYQRLMTINSTYIKAIKEMSEAHNKLVDKGGKLKNKEVTKLVAKHTTKLTALKNQIEKLAN